MISGEVELRLALPAVGHETHAGEAEEDHGPCGGLRNRSDRQVINDGGGLRTGGLRKSECFRASRRSENVILNRSWV